MIKNNKKEKESLLSKLFLVIGLGVSFYGVKKVVDLYVEREEENKNLIDSDDYETLLEIDKENHQGDWDEGLFDYDKIKLDYNADQLFREFLERVELTNEIPDKIFKISDIEKLIPFENMDIENKSTYDYSVMSMLGGQSGRDYFIFKDMEDLRDIFTEECNNSNRNNTLWKKKYGDERFIINPKYYLGRREENRSIELEDEDESS